MSELIQRIGIPIFIQIVLLPQLNLELSSCIRSKIGTEKRRNFRRVELHLFQMRTNIVFKLIKRIRRLFSPNAALQITVDEFIGIIFGSIGRQVKQFNFILMFFKPFGNFFRVVNTKIIQ